MPDPSDEALNTLQDLAELGVIKIKTFWCSELGFRDQDVDKGHFHGLGSYHLVDTFSMVYDPPLAERELKMPEPITVTIPLRKSPPEEESDMDRELWS
jgi:hypothetical protein